MRTLVIDCSTEACSAALFDDDELVDGRCEILGRGHAERLIPMISELPDRGRAQRVVAALGPGSFTGVRVGLAAARALALAWGAQLAGFPTLDLVAAIARSRAGDEAVGVAMAGGHGEWFAQGFSASGGTTRALASLPPDQAVAITGEDLVAGTRAPELVERRGTGHALEIRPDARSFALLPSEATRLAMHPIYGRGPDARMPGVPA